ncbi:MAG: HAMP domain-containing sensor histidine kinase [Anaerolineae bacterium]
MPIRIRLTLWYTVLLAAILVAYSVLLYMVLSFFLHDQIDRNLKERAVQIGTLFEAQSMVVEQGQIMLPPLNVFSSPAVFIQVVDADGRLITANSNMGTQRLPFSPQIHQTNLLGLAKYDTITIDNTPVRIYSAPILVGPPGNVVGAVQVGQSLKTVDTTLQMIALFLSAGTLGTLMLAAVVGAFLSGKALQPIDRINQTAGHIVGGRDLKQRLPATATMDEIGQLTVTINNMLERLDNFFQAQVRLSADVSHELRTPLTVIRGNVDLLRRGATDDPEELTEALQIIDGELDRMSRIVADLLLLSQADAGLSLRMGPVEMDTIVLDVYRQARVMAQGINIRLGHEDVAVVNGDTDRLKQVLINLVTNALKHTPPGGTVTISLYRDPEWVRVIVADTGRGIAPTALPHIFERFYQAKDHNQKGSGLGLSIAQWVAKAHGGQITVTSEQGKGSTFTLWLPLDVPTAPARQPSRPVPITV